MKRSISPDPPEASRADAALDRQIDDALRTIAQPPAVDFRAQVLAGLDTAPRPGWFGPAFWRPAIALAGALVVSLAVFSLWHRVDHQLDVAEGTRGIRLNADPAGERKSGLAGQEKGQRGAAGSADARRTARRTGARSRGVWVEWPAQQAVASNTPHLPGAPAREAGEALEPLPVPPPIVITPITQAPIGVAPPISDIARPVTDFPTDEQPPDTPMRATGQSGGTRR